MRRSCHSAAALRLIVVAYLPSERRAQVCPAARIDQFDDGKQVLCLTAPSQ
jgi:hypothetical protein